MQYCYSDKDRLEVSKLMSHIYCCCLVFRFNFVNFFIIKFCDFERLKKRVMVIDNGLDLENFMEDTDFKKPVIIKDKTGLGLKVPENVTVYDVERAFGKSSSTCYFNSNVCVLRTKLINSMHMCRIMSHITLQNHYLFLQALSTSQRP